MHIWVSGWWKSHRAVVVGAILAVATFVPATAHGQGANGSNSGALRFTGGTDVPSVYFFRGMRQERDPKLTLFPFGDVGIVLASDERGGVKRIGVNVGVWNSLQTGSTGSGGISGRLHYEENFYSSISFGLGGDITTTFGYMALTSPNNMFNTVKEFQLKIAKSGMLAPYGFIGAELTKDGQADGGSKKGSYLELGVGPRWALMKDGPTLAFPIKVGLSLKDYYQLGKDDNKFGYFDIGGLLTIPLKGVPEKFGSWNVHGGADYLRLGDTAAAFNADDKGSRKNQAIGSVGIGLSY